MQGQKSGAQQHGMAGGRAETTDSEHEGEEEQEKHVSVDDDVSNDELDDDFEAPEQTAKRRGQQHSKSQPAAARRRSNMKQAGGTAGRSGRSAEAAAAAAASASVPQAAAQQWLLPSFKASTAWQYSSSNLVRVSQGWGKPRFKPVVRSEALLKQPQVMLQQLALRAHGSAWPGGNIQVGMATPGTWQAAPVCCVHHPAVLCCPFGWGGSGMVRVEIGSR